MMMEDVKDVMMNDEKIRDNTNDPYACGCCSLKCQLITVAICVLFDALFQIFVLLLVKHNKYFDKYYFYIYFILVIPLLVASGLIIIYFIVPDRHDSRKLLLQAFWIAFVADILIGLWILIYLEALYPYNEVYTQNFFGDPNSEEYEK